MKKIKLAKSFPVLLDFIYYCHIHPDERFWQALRNWSGFNYIYGSKADIECINRLINDTFYFEGKDK